jgi:hypothetical protein
MSGPDRSQGDRRLDHLRQEAEHARHRYEHYKDEVHGTTHGDSIRLRQLRRESVSATDRFSRAEGALRAARRGDTHEQEALESERIEAELKRDPDRADTRVARAARAPFTAVRAVRERLGLYFTGL